MISENLKLLLSKIGRLDDIYYKYINNKRYLVLDMHILDFIYFNRFYINIENEIKGCSLFLNMGDDDFLLCFENEFKELNYYADVTQFIDEQKELKEIVNQDVDKSLITEKRGRL